MTVETTTSRQVAQQMGTLYTYPFTFTVLLTDPTEDEALKAIKAKVKQADGSEIDLVYGSGGADGYTVTLNTNRNGGTVTVIDKRTAADYITIYREYEETQEADYQDFNAAPAETYEQCFDKLTMLCQQQQEKIDRCIKVDMTSDITPEVFVDQVVRIYDSIDNVDTVANNSADVSTVADNITDINTCADDIAAIKDAPAQAQAAANSAQSAASSETAAADSERYAEIWAEGTDEEVHAIGGTHSSKVWSEISAGGGANVDLSNLSATGEKHFLNKTQITNGILSVEKLVNVAPSLDDGRLILKQGSIVYVSTNGTFEEVTISSDVGAGSEELYTDNGSRNIYACYVPSINEIRNIPVIQTYSQATAPTTSMMLFNTYCGWLDTTNNIMKYTYDGGATWTVCSLPFALGNPQTISSGGIGWFGKLKVVFNGFGVVGQKTFTTRGVRALLPNGKNTDETLNNKETISTSLTFMDETGKSSLLCFFSGTRILTYGVPNYFEQDEMPTGFTGSAIWLNTEDNIMYNTSNGGTTWTKTGSLRCYLGKLVKAQNGVITEFEPNKPVELLKRSDLNTFSISPDFSRGIISLTKTQNLVQQADEDCYIRITGNNGTDIIVSVCDADGQNDTLLAAADTSTGNATTVFSPLILKGTYFKITRIVGEVGFAKIYAKRSF